MTRPADATAPTAPPAADPARLAGPWQLDGLPDGFADEPGTEYRVPSTEYPAPRTPHPAPPPVAVPRSQQGAEAPRSPAPSAPPPSPVQLLEAMLFVGGPPLTAAAFCGAARVPEEVFRQSIDALVRRYKADRRPYTVRPAGGGFVLAVDARYHSLREKLFGGPKEARLSPPALDVLSAVAYRQPVPKADLDALLGRDVGANLRQLARLGLVAAARRADAAEYGTTPRFLELFGLSSLDDLPRLGTAE